MSVCVGGDILSTAREVLDVEIEAIRAVRERLDGGFTQAVELIMGCTGRVVITGIGKSGLVGRKIAATLSSTGTPAFFLHPVEGAHGDLGMVRADDVVIAISNSGETDELNAILPAIASLGATIIALTGRADSTLGRMAGAVIDAGVPREACPMGLAPTASTTAALALGDALAVCLINLKSFKESDFKARHPGGALGRRLSEPVAALMHRENLPVSGPDLPLSAALTAMTAGRLGFLAVADGEGVLQGILTDGDVRRLLARCGLEGTAPDLTAPVSSLMIRTFKSVTPQTSAAEAVDVMEQKQITVLPVVDGCSGSLVGMVHLHDLLGKGALRFTGLV